LDLTDATVENSTLLPPAYRIPLGSQAKTNPHDGLTYDHGAHRNSY